MINKILKIKQIAILNLHKKAKKNQRYLEQVKEVKKDSQNL